MANKADETTKALRDAYRQNTRKDFERLNKKHFKDTTSYEQNREQYVNTVRKLQKTNPDSFQEIQDRNTDAKIRTLNAIDFDRDEYAQDPISQRAFQDLQYKVSLPFGHMDNKGAYTLPGRALGATTRAEGHPSQGQVAISSGATLPEMQEGRLGLAGLLRHEGQHSNNRDAGHDEIYALDRMYQMRNKGNDNAIPEQYRREPTTGELISLMDDSKKNITQNKLGDPNAIPEGLNEVADWGEVAKLPAKEQLKMLQSASEYELHGRGVVRDLPDEGWWDTLFK